MRFKIGGLAYDAYDPATKQVTRTGAQSTKLATVTSAYMNLANAVNGGSQHEYTDAPKNKRL